MRLISTSVAVTGLLLAGLTGRAWAATEAELVEAARKQPVLNIVTNRLVYGKLLVDGFAKRYSFVKINHEAILPVGWDARPHFIGKDRAKFIDVNLRCQEPTMIRWVDSGWLARLDDLPNWKSGHNPLDPDPRWTFVTGAPAALVYDSQRFSDAEAPRSYAELTEPKWRGKVVFRNPKMGNSGAFLAEFINATRGSLDWYKLLGRNKARMVDTQADVFQVVKTEGFIGITRDVEFLSSPLSAPEHKGRYKMIMMKDELPYQFQLGVISANAPHPATARLFMNWVLSPEAQTLLEESGHSVGKRQSEHLKHPKVWRMDARALLPTHAARLDEAVSLFSAGASELAKTR